jgi:hypothetical protein
MANNNQINIPINSGTLYTRYEAVGAGAGSTVSYYGYSQPSAIDGDVSFAIKKQYYIGNIQYSIWNNNIMGSFESKWTDRAAYFATPSNIVVTATSSTNGSFKDVTFNWTTSTDSSRYTVYAYEDLKYVTNIADASSPTVNPHQNSYNLKLQNNTNSVTLNKCRAGYTYSISVQPSNGFYSGSASTAAVSL